MAPHDRRPGDTLDPEAETPAVHPRRRSSERNLAAGGDNPFDARPHSTGAAVRSWFNIASMLLHGVSVLGGGGGLAVIRYQVSELEKYREEHTKEIAVKHEANEQRFRAIEFKQHDSDGDVRLINQHLESIDKAIGHIDTALTGKTAGQFQPRSPPSATRPMRAPARVDPSP